MYWYVHRSKKKSIKCIWKTNLINNFIEISNFLKQKEEGIIYYQKNFLILRRFSQKIIRNRNEKIWILITLNTLSV